MNCQGDTHADKARELIGKGHPGGDEEGKEKLKAFSAIWLPLASFMVRKLVLQLSLANILTPCPSWWCMHYSAKMASSKVDSGRLVGHVVSPFDLSQILPVGGGLLVPCSLPGPPVTK